MTDPAYSVTLHHLAPDLKAAGLAYPDVVLAQVSPEVLRELLYLLAELSAELSIYEPSTPEIRVKTEQNTFVVRTRYRRLCLVGWESSLRGEEHSIKFIRTTITGLDGYSKTGSKLGATQSTQSASPLPPPKPAKRGRSWLKLVMLGLLTLTINGFTAWQLWRPKPSLLPAYTLLPQSATQALLTHSAGEYATGHEAGDRRLSLDATGTLRLGKLNTQHALIEEELKAVRGATINGRAVLITTDAVLNGVSPDTIVLYGTTYYRTKR